MRYVAQQYVGASESWENPNDEGEPVDLGVCPMFRKKKHIHNMSHGNYHMIVAVLKWVPKHLVIESLYEWRNKHP